MLQGIADCRGEGLSERNCDRDRGAHQSISVIHIRSVLENPKISVQCELDTHTSRVRSRCGRPTTVQRYVFVYLKLFWLRSRTEQASKFHRRVLPIRVAHPSQALRAGRSHLHPVACDLPSVYVVPIFVGVICCTQKGPIDVDLSR